MAAEATGSSLPKQSTRHSPCPTPVGEESYGEKAGAALVRFWETRMLLFNSILQTLLSTHGNEGSHTYTPTGDSEGVGMKKKELEGNAGRKKGGRSRGSY